MKINGYRLMLILAIGIGFVFGTTFQKLSGFSKTVAQEQNEAGIEDKILVKGYGGAISGKRPEEAEFFTLTASNTPLTPFKVVPKGKNFIVTDMLYNARLVNQNLTVNLVNVNMTPSVPNAGITRDIFLQMFLKPQENTETHQCSGFVIPSGHSIAAWTNAGLEPNQFVQIVVTGYLIDQPKH